MNPSVMNDRCVDPAALAGSIEDAVAAAEEAAIEAGKRAFQQGREAWRAGKVHNDNPHANETLAGCWDSGLEAEAHKGY